jgi:cystine transport system permease protein
MFRLTIPTIMGEFEQLLKSTALLATIGVTEVTRVGMNIISRELNPLPIYCTIAIIYLAFSALLHMVMLYQQQRRSYGYR